MDEKNKDFREKLLKVEQINLSYREKYEKDLQALLEPKLSGIERIVFLTGTVFSLVIGIFLLIVGLVGGNKPLLPRLAVLFASLFALLFATHMGLVAIRGSYKTKTEETFFSIIGVIFGGGLLIFMSEIGQMHPDPMKGIFIIAWGIISFGAVSIVFILHNIDLAKIEIREKLLEIEYHLAEISEQLKKK